MLVYAMVLLINDNLLFPHLRSCKACSNACFNKDLEKERIFCRTLILEITTKDLVI